MVPAGDRLSDVDLELMRQELHWVKGTMHMPRGVLTTLCLMVMAASTSLGQTAEELNTRSKEMLTEGNMQ